MATFGQEGAMSEDEILQAVIDYTYPEDAVEATPKSKVESPTPKEEAVETPTDDSEEQEGEVPESEVEDKEEKAEEPWIPSSMDELAEAMEVDVDALKAIKIKTKVDGVEADVPLGEVIKNYQLNKAITTRSEQLAHAKKQFEQAAQEFVQQRDVQLSQWQAWNNVLENRLKEQVGAVDWKQLREDDPAEYAAKRQEFTERIGEIERMKAQMAQQVQQQQMQVLQQQHQAYQQTLEQNIQKLPEIIPEFKDAEKMKSEMTALRTYLNSYFTPEEVDSVYDARHILLARKAMMYDKLVEGGKPKVEQIKQKPKFVKPTARTTKESVDRVEADKKYKRAVKNQTTDDWVNVLMDRM